MIIQDIICSCCFRELTLKINKGSSRASSSHFYYYKWKSCFFILTIFVDYVDIQYFNCLAWKTPEISDTKLVKCID